MSFAHCYTTSTTCSIPPSISRYTTTPTTCPMLHPAPSPLALTRHPETQTHRQTDRQPHSHTDRQTDRQTDTQSHRHTPRHIDTQRSTLNPKPQTISRQP
eukprot:282165-Rhodomonas_salina.1